jgi:hypothetical protein
MPVDPAEAPDGYVAAFASKSCDGCAFERSDPADCPRSATGGQFCLSYSRKDGQSVIFVKKVKKEKKTATGIDPAEAPEGYIAAPVSLGCEGCAFLHSICPHAPTGGTFCLSGSRKDEKSVIFKEKEEKPKFDATDAPEGYVAVPSPTGGACPGCDFHCTSTPCPRTPENSLRCQHGSRRDKQPAIFKKADTPAPPKPVDLRAFDNDTLMRTIGLLLTEATNRHILSSYHLNLPKPPVSEKK